MKAVVLYFLFLLNSADSCLKINYAEPPTCACKSLALDSSNMQTEIGSVDFYQNVSAYPVKAPIISIDDCSGTVLCEGDYSLVVFDTDKVTMFDKYSADGFCDPFTQTWNVDKDGSGSLTTYKNLRGLCVDYSACACKALALWSSIMQNEIGNFDFYQNVSAYPQKVPMIVIGDCSGTVYCLQKEYSLVVFDTDKVTMFDKYSADGICDPYTQTWKIDIDGSGSLTTFKTLRAICVDYSPPKITPKPGANCMSCTTSIDDFIPEVYPYPEYIVRSFSELSPVNGCRRMEVTCSMTGDFVCEPEMIAYSYSNRIVDISTETTISSVHSVVTCGDDGFYHMNHPNLKYITHVECVFSNCM